MSKVANAHELRALLKRPQGHLSKLMLQALFRPLLNEPGVLSEITSYPADGLGRISPERFASKGPYFRFDPSDATYDVIRTIETWLATAVARRDSWLRSVDGHGRVLRLRGLKTIDDVMDLAEADFTRYRASDAQAELAEQARQVRVVLVLPDGKVWVQLVAEEAFRTEGQRMRHCLGKGYHWRQHVKSQASYYSLRDEAGRPRVTVEVMSHYVTEARGTANSQPRPRWLPEIQALCSALGVTDDVPWAADLLSPQPQRHVEPEMVDGDLLIDAETPEMLLPAAMHVRGSLYITRCSWLHRLPQSLTVGGDCSIVACRHLWGMPRYFEVRGNASFVACAGLRRPSYRYEIWGNLDLSSCDRLEVLFPRGRIGRHLDISDCPRFRMLPEGLQVGGSIRRGDFSTTSVRQMNRYLADPEFRRPYGAPAAGGPQELLRH